MLLVLLVSLCHGNNIYLNSSSCGAECNFDEPTIWVGGIVPAANDSVYMIGNSNKQVEVTFNNTWAGAIRTLVLTNNIVFSIHNDFRVAAEVNASESSISITGNYSLIVGSWIYLYNHSFLNVSGEVTTDLVMIDASTIYVPHTPNSKLSGAVITGYVFSAGELIVEAGACLVVKGNYTAYGGKILLQALPSTQVDVEDSVRLIVIGNATFTGVQLNYWFANKAPKSPLALSIIFVNGTSSGYLNPPLGPESGGSIIANFIGPDYIIFKYTPLPSEGVHWYYILAVVLGGILIGIAILNIGQCLRRRWKKRDYSKV